MNYDPTLRLEAPPAPNYTIREWIEVFPELPLEIAPAKLTELRGTLRRVQNARKTKNYLIQCPPSRTASWRHFWLEWIKINEGARAEELTASIAYFKRLMTPPDPTDPFPQQLEDARRVSLVTIAGRRIPSLKQRGKEWPGLCPFP